MLGGPCEAGLKRANKKVVKVTRVARAVEVAVIPPKVEEGRGKEVEEEYRGSACHALPLLSPSPSLPPPPPPPLVPSSPSRSSTSSTTSFRLLNSSLTPLPSTLDDHLPCRNM